MQDWVFRLGLFTNCCPRRPYLHCWLKILDTNLQVFWPLCTVTEARVKLQRMTQNKCIGINFWKCTINTAPVKPLAQKTHSRLKKIGGCKEGFFLPFFALTLQIMVFHSVLRDRSIISPINPKFDDRFFVDLRVLYKPFFCFCFDLQNWQTNFGFATCTKRVYLQRISRQILA